MLARFLFWLMPPLLSALIDRYADDIFIRLITLRFSLRHFLYYVLIFFIFSAAAMPYIDAAFCLAAEVSIVQLCVFWRLCCCQYVSHASALHFAAIFFFSLLMLMPLR